MKEIDQLKKLTESLESLEEFNRPPSSEWDRLVKDVAHLMYNNELTQTDEAMDNLNIFINDVRELLE